MTQAFLIVLRMLCLGVLGYFGYRLWTGTRSLTTRVMAGLFIGVLVWQIVAGAW